MTAPDRPGGVDASDKKRRPPRLLVKTTIAVTLVTMALLLVVVFVVTLSVRDRVREGVAENLESSQRMFATLEARRQRELRAQAVTLSESPTLKAALDTYVAELKTSDQPTRAQLLTTIANELEKLAERFEADAIVLVDTHQSTLAAAGRDAHQWLSGRTGERHFERRRPGQLRRGGSRRQQRVSSRLGAAAAQRRRHDRYAYLATSLDQQYAKALADLSRASIVIVSDRLLLAGSLEPDAAREFEAWIAKSSGIDGTVDLGGEITRVSTTRPDRRHQFLRARIDRSVGSQRDAERHAQPRRFIAAGAMVLAFAGSFRLARLLTQPIGELSASLLKNGIGAWSPRRAAHSTGSSLELDVLTETFNDQTGISFGSRSGEVGRVHGGHSRPRVGT